MVLRGETATTPPRFPSVWASRQYPRVVGSGFLAALIGLVALGFIESLGRFYPARDAWWRLRRLHGRRAVRATRERFESAAASGAPRLLAAVLLALVVVWVTVVRGVLDKSWYAVGVDVLPYVVASAALLRTPSILRAIASRMKEYERQAGEDPDRPLADGEDEGPAALAL
jgi:hypothetical protein